MKMTPVELGLVIRSVLQRDNLTHHEREHAQALHGRLSSETLGHVLSRAGEGNIDAIRFLHDVGVLKFGARDG